MSSLTAVFLGHVDHGKSTLISRLLLDTGHFPDGRLKELKAAAHRRGVPMEISFLLDAFQVERDQAVTIDSSRIWLTTPARTYAIVDAPGHKEFVRHMVSGASEAHVAVLLVDAHEGVSEQTRRHLMLLSLLNVGQVIIVLNKMDLVDFSQSHYESISQQAQDLLTHLNLDSLGVVPAVARDGDNIVKRSTRMEWFTGPTVLELLEAAEPHKHEPAALRFPIQDVYRTGTVRTLVGTVEGSGLKAGANIMVLPLGNSAIVTEIVRYPENGEPARHGEAVGIVLDRPLFVEAGHVACAPEQTPHVVSNLDATIFWLSPNTLRPGDKVRVRIATSDVQGTVAAIERKIDVQTLEYENAESLQNGDISQVNIITEAPLVVERTPGSILSRFALYQDGIVCGGGVVTGIPDVVQARQSSANVFSERHLVSAKARQQRQAHRSGVVWLTGLPSAGKSTLGKRLEQEIYSLGWNTYFLDGDTMRTGLNGDLGFSGDDRRENVRRVGEVAALFADAGLIAIAALVSPSKADRERARQACKSGYFVEAYIYAALEICEERDPKGLYKRARAGEIPDFTGISSAYEPPDHSELVVDTATQTVEECTAQLFEFVHQFFGQNGNLGESLSRNVANSPQTYSVR